MSATSLLLYWKTLSVAGSITKLKDENHFCVDVKKIVSRVDEHDAQAEAARTRCEHLQWSIWAASLAGITQIGLRIAACRGRRLLQGRRCVRGRFTLDGNPYLMSVTYPEIKEAYLLRGDEKYPIGDAALCVSLVDVYHGFAFRVIASHITQQRCAQIHGN